LTLSGSSGSLQKLSRSKTRFKSSARKLILISSSQALTFRKEKFSQRHQVSSSLTTVSPSFMYPQLIGDVLTYYNGDLEMQFFTNLKSELKENFWYLGESQYLMEGEEEKLMDLGEVDFAPKRRSSLNQAHCYKRSNIFQKQLAKQVLFHKGRVELPLDPQ